MDASNDPPSDIELLEEFLAHTSLPGEYKYTHNGSKSTRTPSFYDEHLPNVLRPQEMHLGIPSDTTSGLEDQLKEHLLSRKKLVKLLRKDPDGILRSLEIGWNYGLRRLSGHALATQEDIVVQAQHTVLGVVCDIVTLALYDWTPEQIQRLGDWELLEAGSSPEKETKADILIGMRSKQDIKDRQPPECADIWDVVKDLDPSFMRYICSEECKNLFLGQPMAYLTLLLLLQLVRDSSTKVATLWPSGCPECEKYGVSHSAFFNRNTLVNIPVDADEDFQILHVNDDQLRDEILHILNIIDLDNGASILDDDHSATTRPSLAGSTHGGKWYELVHDDMKMLWNTNFKSQTRTVHLNDIMAWVLPVRNMFIQCWAQMVRHNLTLGFISSHNTSFGIQRGREGGMVTISPLDQAKEPGYILRLSQMVLKAYQDAAERAECHHSDGVPNWQDPYLEDEFPAVRDSPDPSDTVHLEEGSGKTCDNSRELSPKSDDPILLTNETKFGNNDTEDESNSEKSKGRQKKNPKRKGDDSPGFNYDHRRDGGSGGAGAGGNGASSSSGYEKSYSGSTQLSSVKRSEGSSSQSGSNKRARNHPAFCIQAKGLHLAFDCPKEVLKSDGGFSHFDLATDSNMSVPFPSDHAGKVPLSPPTVDISARARTSSSVSTSSGSTTESLSTLGTGSSLPTTPSNPTFGISPQSSPNYKVTQNRHSISPSSILVPLEDQVEAAPDDTIAEESLTTVTNIGIILNHKIRKSSVGIVWGGRMYLEELKVSQESTPVVIKLADWEREPEAGSSVSEHGKIIQEEAKFYHHITHNASASDITPRFYGVFNYSGAIALVLNHGGERLKSFDDLNKERKYTLFKKVIELHSLGIQHGDLFPRNILMDNEKVLRIVDFHRSTWKHICPGHKNCVELTKLREALGLPLEEQ